MATRILIDLAERQVRELATIAEWERRSRAAIIRDAVQAYIGRHEQRFATDVFGIWKNTVVDTLAYQRELRREW